ncbi:cobyrinate a,c-diamide synthase [Dethiobacter alkaliphilus]|uniref:cobyrinate a,c-diamide synthase n=1 Tax=Dethiobacter alkaliphilus TaxID=427926 RepID=UPI0022274B05|nr:cobyrinate a,c-diamide synthase [Dethiobacter alkaliphilus]MCW3491485.1 cobyrinate a,c-diamide synthase [Dethiobacter alkaliphilus]
MKRILIAGTHSGVGKTTITAGLIAALRRRGHAVIPFKVGPDYIDPGFHGAAAGVAAGNLDSWMVPPDQVLETLERRVPENAVAVIEGVMGLFDGRKNMGEVGSSAHVAKLTSTPVILVASGAKMARSAAALVGGYVNFDQQLNVAGVILNHLSGDSHYRLLKEALDEHLTLPVFGYLPKETKVAIPERHLGLLPSAEKAALGELFSSLADLVESNLDVDAILRAAEKAPPLPKPEKRVFPEDTVSALCRIAVAQDKAFHFYYPENLDLLRAYGARIVPFSPLEDPGLPENVQGVMLGGGFPEMFADLLAENTSLMAALQSAVNDGMPVYAECGGYMMLARELADFKGERFAMSGVFPGRAVMRGKRRALGYVEVAGAPGNYLLPEDETCRGHEFHWSDMQDVSSEPLYLREPAKEPVGEQAKNCLGSYIHLHFLSNPGVARRFVEKCAAYGKNGGEHEDR